MSAETLRFIRIVLLKATHWPFVALILGYETGRLRLEQRREARSTTVFARRPGHLNLLRQPLSGKGMMQKRLLMTGTLKSQLDQVPRADRQTPKPAVIQTQPSLETAVADLKAHVEEILSIIAKDRANA